jgi:hypothetical protein
MHSQRRREKDIPKCPFCRVEIARPVKTNTDLGEILTGKCRCGAIFVCDLTGRCVGEAYMEALVLLKGDWDIGVLDPDKDYSYSDMDYDYRTHRKIDISTAGESPGKLVFLKKIGVSEDIQQVSAIHEEPKMVPGRANQKKIVKKLLQDGDLKKVADMSLDDRGIINLLFSFSYDKENVMTWRAIESVGLIAEKLSLIDPEFIRNTARRLLWAMTEESGGISWSAPEMLGEIIRANPQQSNDLVPILWSNRNEDVFKAGTIWAMGRIADVSPERVAFIYQELEKMLEDTDPQIIGYSIIVFSKIGGASTINDIKKFLGDERIINLYKDRNLIKISIGEVALQTINSIS